MVEVSMTFPYILMGDSFYGMWTSPPFKNITNLGYNASSTYDQKLYIQQTYPIDHEGMIMNVGTNNLSQNQTIEEITTTYGEMLDFMLAIFDKIYCVSVIPINHVKYAANIGTGGHYLYNTPARMSALNTAIQGLCTSKGCHYIDLVSSFSTTGDCTGEMKTEYTDDGIHPNTAGYAKYAEVLRANVPDLD
jgi:lysophospholipase L1-like esterase